MKNLNEDEIIEVYKRVSPQVPNFCGCAKCRDDAISLALNHVRPRYATGEPPDGAVLSRIELRSETGRAELISVVMDAVRQVASRPRHPTPPLGTPVVS
jgi:competence protein ComFB